jgi:hypothetical protein
MIALADIAWAQRSSLIAQLTNDSEKEWVFKAFDINLGSEKPCTTGKIYVFKVGKKVDVKTCENGSVQVKTHDWEIREDDFDSYIRFNDEEFRTIYSKRKNPLGLIEEELVLRIEGTKSAPTTDIILKHLP